MTSILGFGGYVPERVMTNEHWAELVDTSDEWITARTGIKERRIADDSQSTVDLAVEAAKLALKDAALDPIDIDEIIVATDTPELYLPDTASFVQHVLGCRPIVAYDLGGTGCAGWVQALDVARARIALEPKRILVIGVELLMRLLSWEDRSTAVLFGDGAGAVVVGPGPGQADVVDVVAGTDGSQAHILMLEAGGTRVPFSVDVAERGAHRHLVMNGQEVFREAVKRMSDSVAELLERNAKTANDVALVVPHQANKRIIDAVRRRVGVDEDKVYVNVDRYGNTGSASVPLALWEARMSGRVVDGDLVVLTAFGAGFHWASAALQF